MIYNYIQSLYLCFVFSYFGIYFAFVEHAYYASSSYCFTIHSPLPFTMMAAFDFDRCLCSNVKIGLGDGLVPQGGKPLPEPIGTKMYDAKLRHWGTNSLNCRLKFIALIYIYKGLTNGIHFVWILTILSSYNWPPVYIDCHFQYWIMGNVLSIIDRKRVTRRGAG